MSATTLTVREETPFRRFAADFAQSRMAVLGLVVFGLLLVLSAAFVRVRLPGGLAFAIGAMLGLQALAAHNAVHLAGGVGWQISRAAVAIVLVALAASAESG